MPARIRSAALSGIDATSIDIEAEVLPGLPSYTVVGLPDKAIQESRERLTASLVFLGFTPPRRKTIVSLAPASLKKEGSLYDVPIAIGFLKASKQLSSPAASFQKAWFVGELGLDGTIRPVKGVLPIALAAVRQKIPTLYIPADNARETGGLADRIDIYPIASLQQLVSHLEKKQVLSPQLKTEETSLSLPPEIDFADVKGQPQAKRALAIAAAGHHHALLVGPPGAGKTILARAVAGILPPLTQEEVFTVSSLYSVAGLLSVEHGLIQHRPFRHPHHGASSVALIGGGTHPRPGEVSLAHAGVLFLDELPEFSRHTLDQLRQPLEEGTVVVSRAAQTVRYPARPMVVAAMNPCKCGYFGSNQKDCQCSPGDVVRYQRKVSGPLLDRFDLHVLVSDIPADELLEDESVRVQTSQVIRKQVAAARQRQVARQGKPNSQLSVRDLKKYCQLDPLSKRLIVQAQHRFHVSSRGIHRIMKVARTIADLGQSDPVNSTHIAEAIQYREQLHATQVAVL